MPRYFVLKALADAGRYESVYRLLVNEGEHGWVNMLREGASACFEAWGKEQKWNTSLCHPWATAPVSILIEELAGIHPDPGEHNGYRFEPHIPGFHKRILPYRPLWRKAVESDKGGWENRFVSKGLLLTRHCPARCFQAAGMKIPEAASAIWSRMLHICASRSVLLGTQ